MQTVETETEAPTPAKEPKLSPGCTGKYIYNQLLTLGTHAQRGSRHLCVSLVCLSICLFAVLKALLLSLCLSAKKRYQHIQCHTGLIYKMAIFVNPLRSLAMVWNNQKSQEVLPHLGQSFAALLTVEASEVTQRSRHESKTVFKCYLRIQLSSRSEKRSTECVVVDYTHVFT